MKSDLQGLVEKWRERADLNKKINGVDLGVKMGLRSCADELAEVIGRNVPDGAEPTTSTEVHAETAAHYEAATIRNMKGLLMPKWHITLEWIRGTWVVLILHGRETKACATADDLEMALSMAGELFEGCLEWPEKSGEEIKLRPDAESCPVQPANVPDDAGERDIDQKIGDFADWYALEMQRRGREAGVANWRDFGVSGFDIEIIKAFVEWQKPESRPVQQPVTEGDEIYELLTTISVWEEEYRRINNLGGSPEWVGRLDRALAARHVPVGTGWISVEEKLPEMDGTEYLICRSGYMASGLEFKNGLEIEAANGQAVWYGFHTRGFGVTHWQPLPASPLAHSPAPKIPDEVFAQVKRIHQAAEDLTGAHSPEGKET